MALAQEHPGFIDAAVGIHPHHVAAATDAAWAEIADLAAAPGVVALGEMGLDFHRNLSPREAQLDGLARQLALAADRRLPVIVHDRDAHAAVAEALLAWDGPAGRRRRGILHCFSGDRALATRLSAAGYLVSFALPVTFSSARDQRDVAAWLPEGRLLAETDAPWLGPGAGTRNEPRTVLRVIDAIARLRGVEASRLVAQIAAAYGELLA